MGKDNKKDKKKNKEKAAESSRRWRTGQLNKKERKAMERYGLDANDYAFEGQSYRHEKGSYDDMREDFLRAARNDYDTRRGIEAMAMHGNKKAEKLAKGGFMNPADVMNANNIQRKEHRKAGNGGDFSSASDFAGTSFRSVQKDRKMFTEDIKGMIPEQMSTGAADNVEDEPKEVVLSEHMQQAKERVDQWEDYDYPVYNPEAREAQKTGEKFAIDKKIDINNVGSEEAAQDLLTKKKEEVKGDFNFQPVY